MCKMSGDKVYFYFFFYKVMGLLSTGLLRLVWYTCCPALFKILIVSRKYLTISTMDSIPFVHFSLDTKHTRQFASWRNIVNYPWSTVQCSAVQCGALQCSAVQCSAVQCSAVQCSAVQCSAVQCSAVQCSAVQCSAVQCTEECMSAW